MLKGKAEIASLRLRLEFTLTGFYYFKWNHNLRNGL